MAVSFDSVTVNTSSSNRTNPSFSVDGGTGSDRGMLGVFAYLDNESGALSVTANDYNSSNLSAEDSATTNIIFNQDLGAAVRSLIAHSTGSNTFAATYSVNALADMAGACVLTGVDQTDMVGATQTATGDSTNPTLTITTTEDNSLIVFVVCIRDGGNSLTVNTGTQQAQAGTGGSSTQDIRYFVGTLTTTTAGNYTPDLTATSSDNWAMVAVEVKEAGGGGGATADIERGTMRGIVRGVYRGI